MIDFIGIGGQKCGTTWLFHHLQTLPDVRFPAGKEVHFWNDHRDAGVDRWLALFPDVPAPIKQGEITPAYATLDRATVTELREVAPGVRLFLSVRNPMERAWSAALMFLNRCQMDPSEASDQWFIDLFGSLNSRLRGDFSHTIDRWRAVFAPDQLHLIVYDDIAIDPRSVLIGLARHVGVDPSPFGRAPDDVLGTVVRPRNYGPEKEEARARTALRPTLRAPLFDLYAAEVERLSKVLQRDVSHWLQWDGTP